jgi:hypothetical protein
MMLTPSSDRDSCRAIPADCPVPRSIRAVMLDSIVVADIPL